MQTYITILRGINVSGKNLIKMDALKKMLEDLDLKNVVTYIQSGNIIFTNKKENPNILERKISKKITETFGLDIPVIVKDLFEFNDVFNSNPFIIKRNEDISKLHVTFLASVPEKVMIDDVKKANYTPDEFIVMNKTVYLFCPNGYGNTKLTNTFFEKKFNTTATTRNWNTITKLIDIASNI